MEPDELKSKSLDDGQNSNTESLNDESTLNDSVVQEPVSEVEPQAPNLTSEDSSYEQTDLSQPNSTEGESETISTEEEPRVSDSFSGEPVSEVEPQAPNLTSEVISGSEGSQILQESFVSSSTKKSIFNKKNKFLFILVIIIVVLFGGSAYAYFGYYMSSATIWNDSLGNASSGYNKLVSYVNTQSTAGYKGISVNGSFNLQMGSSHDNGSLNFESYDKNSTASIKLDFGVSNLDLEERSIAVSASLDPNLYFQVNGVNQLGGYFPNEAPILDKINGQWIEVDHNLIADLTSSSSSKQASTPSPSWSSLGSYLLTTSSINKKYLFSSNKSYAVLRILKSYGKETINGVNTEHYLVGFNKANTKSYLNALCSAFVSSSLGNYFKQQSNSLFQLNASSCSNFSASANSLNSSDTFQLWDNVDNRIPYMVRFSKKNNPLENYIDLGLNYNNGTSYPFFITGTSKSYGATTNFTSNITLDTSNNSLLATLNVTSNSSNNKDVFNGNFSFIPTDKVLNVQVPAGSIPLPTELNNLGIPLPISGLSTSSTIPTAL